MNRRTRFESFPMVAPFGGLVEVGLASFTEAGRPPISSLPRTTEPAPQQACADGVAGFARGLRVLGSFFHSTHPVRSARARSFAARATCARPSTFKQGTRCAAFPAFSKSLHSPSRAREMAERMDCAAAVCASCFMSSSAPFGRRPFVEPITGFSPLQRAWAKRIGRRPKAVAPTASFTAMGIANMGQSFPPTDRQLKASTGNGTQVGMPFMGVVPDAQLLPSSVIESATFNGCLVEAARHSGLEDQEIADAIHICHGYMSRFMRGVAQQWAKRMVAFMRVTHSLAPLQWMAREMGCELVIRDSQAARIAALQAELHALTGRAAA